MLNLFKTRCVFTQNKIIIFRLSQMKWEHISMKVWCLKCLSVRIRQMNKVHLMGYRILLFARLLAFWVCSWMSSIRNKAELSSIQKRTFITAITDKKIISVFCVWGYFAPHFSLLLKLNSDYLQLDSLFFWNSQHQSKKLISNYI